MHAALLTVLRPAPLMTFRKSFDTLAQSSAEWNHRHSTCRRKRSSQARFQHQPCALHMLAGCSPKYRSESTSANTSPLFVYSR